MCMGEMWSRQCVMREIGPLTEVTRLPGKASEGWAEAAKAPALQNIH